MHLSHLLLNEHWGIVVPALRGEKSRDGCGVCKLLEHKEVECEVAGGVDGLS